MSYGGECAYGDGPVDAEHAAYRITGVEFTREQGGANVIHDRERVPNWIAHQRCAEKAIREKRQGIAEGQATLA